jgi:uncharacterized protein YjbJ (UPF0337 family)
MNKSDVQNTAILSETITEQHPDARFNRGRYKRTSSRTGETTFKGDWKQQINAASIIWDKLTEDELLDTEGDEQKLTSLIQERYAITRAAAWKQVANFLAKSCC